jgi:hypothetical protein
LKHGAWIAAGLLTWICTACVSFRFERTSVNVPPRAGAVEGLKPGESSLEQCLQQLGAPLYVWEYQGSGAALAWGWELTHARGVTLSVPLEESSITAGSYDDLRQDSARLRALLRRAAASSPSCAGDTCATLRGRARAPSSGGGSRRTEAPVMQRTTATTCPLDCPDACGVLVESGERGELLRLRGNPAHPWSRGVLCGKTQLYGELIGSGERLLTRSFAVEVARAPSSCRPSGTRRSTSSRGGWRPCHRPRSWPCGTAARWASCSASSRCG